MTPLTSHAIIWSLVILAFYIAQKAAEKDQDRARAQDDPDSL